ncbi:phosphoribosylformylglycinamidine synthase subunit PurQ [Anaplasma bovis]|uniref:phosphoribosylformylglycinamidine synthase subunit PurQ n=1 Tax=Anaplasma bovis TaxID=186733 RepID=UPI002FEEC602
MNVIILAGYGLNCEEETAFAFREAGRYLNAKVACKVVHVNELILNPTVLKECNIMAIPGGFSYGDDTGAGNAFALKIVNKLADVVQEFIARDTLMLGICNGCQILVRMFCSDVALIDNDLGRYQCCWTRLKPCNDSVWLRDIDELYIPIAHGEGKFHAHENVCVEMSKRGDIALRYVDTNGEYAEGKFPHNPNGSAYDIAALSCHGGRTLMMMPHPERALFFTQRYDWTDIACERKKGGKSPVLDVYADGFKLFTNAVKYFM